MLIVDAIARSSLRLANIIQCKERTNYYDIYIPTMNHESPIKLNDLNTVQSAQSLSLVEWGEVLSFSLFLGWVIKDAKSVPLRSCQVGINSPFTLICFVSSANSDMLATVYHCWIQKKLLSGSWSLRNASKRPKLLGRVRKCHLHHLPHSFPKLLYCQDTDPWPPGVQQWCYTSHNAGGYYLQDGYEFPHNL